MNDITIVGRLTRDPEFYPERNGKSQYVRFSVAVDQRFGDGTDFFDVVAFGKRAEAIRKYTHKGKQVAIRGEMQSRKYQTRDGSNRIGWTIFADEVEFLGSAKDGHPAQQTAAAPAGTRAPEQQTWMDVNEGDPDDDVPF